MTSPRIFALLATLALAGALHAAPDQPVALKAAPDQPVALSAAPDPVAPSTPEMYDEALGAHAAKDQRKAAALLFTWIRGAPRTAEGYEAAEHLLAEDLAALGLTHAALIYETDVVRNRARPELLSQALLRLDQWTREVPHDEVRLEEEVLHGTDFGFLEGPARAYVAYHQGALDLRAGNDRWANARFNELPKDSGYRARARLLSSVMKLGRGGEQAKAQLEELEAIAADKNAPRDVRNDARIQAARLRFEAGDFAAALAHYDAVDLPELDPGRGQLYLEQAWAQYRKGEGGRAMGLLAALDAPSFRQLFLPEKFLLRALIYKDACQWLAAKRAARGLLRRYKDSIDAIHDRRPLEQEPLLADAALQKGSGRRAAALVERLQKERGLLDGLAGTWSESGLQQRLASLYASEQAEAERRRQLELEKGVIRVADELLLAAEQVNLVDYEVGLALYRRARGSGPASALTFADPTPGKGEVGFEFDGEYWNDELPVLRFALVNRCLEGVAP